MATILEFTPTPSRVGAGTLSGVAAEVVLFPGVRYERCDIEPQPQSETASEARPKKRGFNARRDLLELED